MTSATLIDPTPTPARPAVVTVAFWFQVALVVLMLIVAGVTIADAVHYSGLINEAVRTTTNPDTTSVTWEREDNVAGTLFLAIPLTVLAIWLGITAVFLRRGSNAARILTWVGLGLPTLCTLVTCSFAFVSIFAFATFAPDFDEPAPGEDPSVYDDPAFDDGFTESVTNLDTGAWSVVSDVITATGIVLILLLGAATVALLLTGPANRWFRRGEPARRPPFRPQFPSPYGYQPVPYPPSAPYGYAAPYSPYGYTAAPTPYGYAAPPPPWAAAPAPRAASPYPSAGPPAPAGPSFPPAEPFPPAAASFPPATPFPPAASTFPTPSAGIDPTPSPDPTPPGPESKD